MTGVVESLCTLAGEALVAVGSAMRTRREGFSEYEAGDFLLSGSGRMESDGPDQTDGVPSIPPAPRPNPTPDQLRSMIDELDDSSLLNTAATVIAGWKPLLLKTTGDLTDVDVLVAALRDRAAQFEDVERDCGDAWLSPEHLHANLTNLPRRGQ